MKVDLHCHSFYSDGTLSPSEVVDLAIANEVDMLALTDHDSVYGLQEARQHANSKAISLIDGVEVSVQWESLTIHIVGLNIDPNHHSIIQLLNTNAEFRQKRLEQMVEKLLKVDIDVMPYLTSIIPENGLVTRTHIARALVEMNVVNRMDKAFKKYLGKGKCAYAPGEWVGMQEAVNAINESGGVPVIAHPMRYRMGANRLERLVKEFAQIGGKALEVVTATQDINQQRRCLQLAENYDLHASIGSDFHSLDQPWAILGRCPNLPSSATPVWQHWTN